jgi:hypothetical protein
VAGGGRIPPGGTHPAQANGNIRPAPGFADFAGNTDATVTISTAGESGLEQESELLECDGTGEDDGCS